MKFVLALVLVGLTAPSVYAQRDGRGPGDGRGGQRDELTERADRVVWRLRRDGFRLTESEKRSVTSHLSAIEDILSGPARPRAEMVCVARDNDGAAPFVLAFRSDPITFNRVNNAVFSTVRDCERAFQQVRQLDYNSALMCISRDRDGTSPWALGMLDVDRQIVNPLVLQTSGSLDECVRRLSEARDYGSTGLGFCSSRDNDNANPWVIRLLRPDGTISSGTQTFVSYDACMRAL